MQPSMEIERIQTRNKEWDQHANTFPDELLVE